MQCSMSSTVGIIWSHLQRSRHVVRLGKTNFADISW
jgi:hypothetical protein